jgi:high affinity Mn2+ porin
MTFRAAAVVFAFGMICAAQEPAQNPPQAPENPPAREGEVPQQPENKTPEQPEKEERWNLFWQATTIGQYHGTFRSPYEGPDSLEDTPEHGYSITSTIFFGLRLDENTQLYFNPEAAGGYGFSHVDGIANAPNGELPRVAAVHLTPYLARLYIQHDFGWGSEREAFESEENQLGGSRPMNRYTVAVGRFTLTDFFDNNRYTHDPRTQFMGWGIMYNGAWDYPADTRGYTWGLLQELHTTNWSFRYAAAMEPKVANGEQFDRRVLRDRGDNFEVERRYTIRKHPGTIRALEFLLHTDSGSYQEALNLAKETDTTPSVVATRAVGRLKYGIGLNLEQEITSDIGVFSRLGWNDGKTESFAFTAIDRLASAGVSVTGTRWHRHFDTAATELTVSGLSAVHAAYLAAGGLDFLIGDGRLNYGPEYVWETYYSARLAKGFFATIDMQHVANPAYNQDRGPVWIPSLRLHVEFGR